MTNELKIQLADLYLDYVNNFLTMERFAEYLDVSVTQSLTLINLGRDYHEERVAK